MATAERRMSSTRRGMTVLGKIPAAPKPINLPSQRLENQVLAPHLDRGTFSWGSARRLNSSGCKSASIDKNENENENVLKSANIVTSNNKGEGLVEKDDGHLVMEGIASPPSSAGKGSGSLAKNAKSSTPSTSGPENTRISSENVTMLDEKEDLMHGHEQASDPKPHLNKDEGKRGDSKLPSGPGYTSDAYNTYPPFFMPGMAYAPGPYHPHDGSYGMPSMPYYSGTKGREVVIIHMYGNPGFYGGFFPHPLLPEPYGRPLMYGQYPLQFGQFEHVVYPEHGMEDGVSQGTNTPFFHEQTEYAQYGHENCSDEWSQGNSVGSDLQFGEAEFLAPTSMPCFPKHDMSKKVGRSHWNVKGIRTKPSRAVPLPGRRVTLLTKVSQHEIIINSLHKEGQDTGTESPTTTLVNLPVSPPFRKKTHKDEGMEKTLEGTPVADKYVDCHIIPSSTRDVDPVQTGLPENIMESKVATSCNNMHEDNSTCVPSPALSSLHTEEHSIVSSKNPYPTISPSSTLNGWCDNTEGNKFQEIGPSEEKNCLKNCVQKQEDELDMGAEKCGPRGIDAEKRVGRKHEYKLFISKPKMGRKMFMPKIQKAILTKKSNNRDIKQISDSEVRTQSIMCCNENLLSEMDACGSMPTMNISKDIKSVVHNLHDLDLSNSSIPDDQEKNIKLNDPRTCSSTSFHVSDKLKECVEKRQNVSKFNKQAEKSSFNKYLKGWGLSSSDHVDEIRKWVSKGFTKRNKLKRVYVPKVQKPLKHKNVVIPKVEIPAIQECTKDVILPQAATIIAQNPVVNCTEENTLDKLKSTVAISEPERKDAGLQTCSTHIGMSLCEVNVSPVRNLCLSDAHALKAQCKNREKIKVAQCKNREKKTASATGGFENMPLSRTRQEDLANMIGGNGHKYKKDPKNLIYVPVSRDTILKPSSSGLHLQNQVNQVKGGCEPKRTEKHAVENAESGNHHEHLAKEVKGRVQDENLISNEFPREQKPKVPDSSTKKWEVRQRHGKANMGRKVFIPKIRKDLEQAYASESTVKASFTDMSSSKSNACPINAASEPGSKIHQFIDVASDLKTEAFLIGMTSQSDPNTKTGSGDGMEVTPLDFSACSSFSDSIPREENKGNGCYTAARATSVGMQMTPLKTDQWKELKQGTNGVGLRFGKCLKEWRPKMARPSS